MTIPILTRDREMKSERWFNSNKNEWSSVFSSQIPNIIPGLRSVHKRGGDEIPPTSRNNDKNSVMDVSVLQTDGKGNLVDAEGRKRVLKGINVDGAMKHPVKPNLPSYIGNCRDSEDVFFDGDNVSFVGRPFPLEEAEDHFLRIKSWGYNTIRYLITWEALEHKGPGIYDDEFIDYTIEILKIIDKVGGLFVFFDMHQDVWSRFSGGSGAPMWTFYAAGLQPTRFAESHAAVLHNDPNFAGNYPKMIWTTNYKRLASLVMFTLFFSGKNYCHNCKINGINIQDYLQDHYFGAVEHLWRRLNDELPSLFSNGCILGFESMNEPNCGLAGHDHIGRIPSDQALRVGTTPTVYQSMRLGMGFPCEVETYQITVSGPQKNGVEVLDPKGKRAWLTKEEAKKVDLKYGWKRCKKWKMGECIFAQHKIWKWHDDTNFDEMESLGVNSRLAISNRKCELLAPNYFNQVYERHNFRTADGTIPQKIDKEYFINNNFVDFYLRHKTMIRKVRPNIFVFLQAPVLEIPPDLKTDNRHIIDSKTIYTPHYYDGMSLMFKTWNSKYNVDTLGIMRNRYLNPILGLVIGERAIRNCLRKQFNEIIAECEKYLGSIPVLMSETGMPYDMNDKKSYEDGKYQSQTSALDALSYALEGSNMHHTYWCYTSTNCHEWGDNWNNEDFSFWSPDDRNLQYDEFEPEGSNSRFSSLRSTMYSIRKFQTDTSNSLRSRYLLSSRDRPQSKENEDKDGFAENFNAESSDIEGSTDFNISESFSEQDYTDTKSIQSSSIVSATSENVQFKHGRRCYPSPDGVRAISAVVRPYVVATSGNIDSSEFDLKNVRFSLHLSFDNGPAAASKYPTVVFVPKWHYPFLNQGDIYVSSGKIKYNRELEYIEWYHENNTEHDTEKSVSSSESLDVTEVLVIKNISGSMDGYKEREPRISGSGADQVDCPVT